MMTVDMYITTTKYTRLRVILKDRKRFVLVIGQNDGRSPYHICGQNGCADVGIINGVPLQSSVLPPLRNITDINRNIM